MTIRAAREAYLAARPHAREVAEELFAQRMSGYLADVEHEVCQAYQGGASVAQLCREYGTTNRSTITDILKRAGVYNPGVFWGERP